MTHVLILGANGQLARNTTRVFLRNTDAKLTPYLRPANRLKNPDPERVRIVEGDVLDRPTLGAAMRGRTWSTPTSPPGDARRSKAMFLRVAGSAGVGTVGAMAERRLTSSGDPSPGGSTQGGYPAVLPRRESTELNSLVRV